MSLTPGCHDPISCGTGPRSGGGRESNPPGSFRPLTGFEDREAHQAPFRLRAEDSCERAPPTETNAKREPALASPRLLFGLLVPQSSPPLEPGPEELEPGPELSS